MRFINTICIAVLVAGSCDRNVDVSPKTLDFGQFTIVVPETWKPVDDAGYDSFVGKISIDGKSEISFDLGWYSSELDVEPAKHEIMWTTIDGRKAKIVKALVAGEGTTGVYFDSLEASGTLKFQMSGQDVNSALQQQLLAAFETLKFRNVNELPSSVPSCIEDVIKEIESEPVRNPSGSVWQYDYDGHTVYYIPAYCCDIPSTLLDADCNFICSPDGGFTGQGDGKCTATLENGVQIWKDLR